MTMVAPLRRAAVVALALLGAGGCSLLFDASEYGSGSDGEPEPEPDTPLGESWLVVAGGAVAVAPNVLPGAVYVSKVGADGELGAWTEWTGAGVLPEGRHRAALVAVGDSLTFVGGYTASEGSRGSVFQATFDPLGAAWQTAPEALPVPRGRHAAVVVGGRLYVSGGRGTGYPTTTSVVVASLDASGALGPFAQAREMPAPRELHVMLANDTFIWVLTGYDATTETSSGEGWVSEVGPDGSLGPFRAVTRLPGGGGLDTAGGALTDSHVYLVGGSGSDPGRVLASRHAPADGALEGWIDVAPLVQPRVGHAVVEVNDRLYAIAGMDGDSTLLASVEVAEILPDGELAPWKETTPLPRPLFTHSAAVIRR